MSNRPEWHDWLLETGVEINPGAGWDETHHALLDAARAMERKMIAATEDRDDRNRAAVGRDFLPEVRRSKHCLIACKLVAEGVNPYHESCEREEWLGLAEGEMSDWPRHHEIAAEWGVRLDYLARAGFDGYEVTEKYRTIHRGLTPYNE